MESKTQISSMYREAARAAVMALAMAAVAQAQTWIEQQQSLDLTQQRLQHERTTAENSKIPLQQTFNEFLIRIDGTSEKINQQLQSAQRESPELASALILTVAYISYLHNKIRVGTLIIDGPDPVAPTIPFPSLLARSPLIRQCAEGDLNACQNCAPARGCNNPDETQDVRQSLGGLPCHSS